MEICWIGLDSFVLFWSANLRRLERFAAAEENCAEEPVVIVDCCHDKLEMASQNARQ